MEKRKYDSTVARIAGNLLSGAFEHFNGGAYHEDVIESTAREAVRWARAIVAEVQRTEPEAK